MGQDDNKQLKVAVIGGGGAGMAASYILQQKHDVTLFEKNPEIGGNVIPIPVEDGKYLDVGFGVFNPASYPNLKKFLDILQVPHTHTMLTLNTYDHSFKNKLSSDLQWYNFFLKIGDIFKMFIYLRYLFKITKTVLRSKDKEYDTLSTRDFFKRHQYSDNFIYYFFLPLSVMFWPLCCTNPLDLPIKGILLSVNYHNAYNPLSFLTWRTVRGSGMEYINGFKKSFNGKIICNSKIKTIKRKNKNQKIVIVMSDSTEHVFDRLVMATPADTALQLLEKPTEKEKSILGSLRYDNYPFIVHTYDAFFKEKAICHVFIDTIENNCSGSLNMDLSRYKKLKTKKTYYWTSNKMFDIPDSHIVYKTSVRMPLFTSESLKKQSLYSSLNGELNTYYCGNYFLYGRHECAIKSAMAVGKEFGLSLL